MPGFVNKQIAAELEGPWVSVLILVHHHVLATPQLNNEGSFFDLGSPVQSTIIGVNSALSQSQTS